MYIDRIGIHFGDAFTIHFYALLIITGILAATYLGIRRAKTYGQNPEHVLDMFTWVILAGVLGARLWHVLTPSPNLIAQGITTQYYFEHPLEILMIWKGGLGIIGAVAGGVLALFVYVKSKKLSFATWLDILAPGVILAQAIGRWGNFVNQELYGAPTNLPWAIYIDEAHRLPEFTQYAYYHPTFLYESLWNIAAMFLMLWMTRKFFEILKPGDIFATYVILYGIGRILMETIRLDSSQLGGVNANQATMLVLAVLALVFIYFNHKFRKVKPEIIE